MPWPKLSQWIACPKFDNFVAIYAIQLKLYLTTGPGSQALAPGKFGFGLSS